MNSLAMSPAELAALQKSPTLLVEAINTLLGQASFLAEHYELLTGKPLGLSLPESVQIPVVQTGIDYDANGISPPRADGCVRIRAWDDAIAAALDSSDPVVQAWGKRSAESPWIYIQDMLRSPLISATQKRAIGTNCGNARFMNATLGGNTKAFAFPAYTVFVNEQGNLRMGDSIPDAFAVNDDRVTLTGEVKSRGWWASDMKRLAADSLAYFIVTSGPSVLRALGK